MTEVRLLAWAVFWFMYTNARALLYLITEMVRRRASDN